MLSKLIADSGSTKCEWCLLADGKKKKIITQGISPYFVSEEQLHGILQKELMQVGEDAADGTEIQTSFCIDSYC